jgi:hypothetical protein
VSDNNNESGVADVAEHTGTSVVLSEEGVHKLVYWSIDKAGNEEWAHIVSVSIDKTAPEVAVPLKEFPIWPSTRVAVTRGKVNILNSRVLASRTLFIY